MVSKSKSSAIDAQIKRYVKKIEGTKKEFTQLSLF